ncbi:MAG TPA: ATPase domain-containing protein [Longimicrobium sp.]|jgi:circadian clock protein KaiC
MSKIVPPDVPRAATGIEGLDRILGGGLPRGEIYLVEGEPGTGKSLVGLHFLRAGAELGERSLLITMAQSREAIGRLAASHGWTMDGIEVHEISAEKLVPGLGAEQVLFQTADVELSETMQAVQSVIEQYRPDRVVFDAVSELRLLANDPARYQRQLFILKELFANRGATVVFLDNHPLTPGHSELQYLAFGVILLSHTPTRYGNERRQLRVMKVRGIRYQEGIHDFVIETGGVIVFPRLTTRGRVSNAWSAHESGIEEIDEMLGGGLAEGSSTLFLGPSGTGKSSLASHYAYAAAQRDEHSIFFLFDERPETFIHRSAGIGMDLRPHLDAGRIVLHEVDTGSVSPGEFAEMVRVQVQERGVRLVVIDSLTGYMSAMPDERMLITQMHELLTYLSSQAVLSILIVAQHGVLGPTVGAPVDVSYLADTVLLLRHFEADGAIRRAISVFKKRYGNHGHGIREFQITSRGIEVGEPLTGFRGVLSGSPTFEGPAASLMELKEEPPAR